MRQKIHEIDPNGNLVVSLLKKKKFFSHEPRKGFEIHSCNFVTPPKNSAQSCCCRRRLHIHDFVRGGDDDAEDADPTSFA